MLEGVIRCHPLISRGISTGASDAERVLDQNSRTWTIRFALYGREELVDANYRVTERILGGIPGVDGVAQDLRRQRPDRAGRP